MSRSSPRRLQPTSDAVGRFLLVPGAVFLCMTLLGCMTNGEFWERDVGGSYGGGIAYESDGIARGPSAPPPVDVRRTPRAPSAPIDAPPPNWTPPRPAPDRVVTRTVPERPSARPPARPTPAPRTGLAAGPTAEDLQVLDRVNQIRRSRGLRALRFQQQLWVAARDHSQEQHVHKYMGHGSPDPRRDNLGDRIRLAGYDGLAWAEVVAWGYRDVNGVVQGWMDSRPHRKILVDPDLTEAGFHRVGLYWTGNFGTPRRKMRTIGAPTRPRSVPSTPPPPPPVPRQAPPPAPRGFG